jgi:hypothetical protein
MMHATIERCFIYMNVPPSHSVSSGLKNNCINNQMWLSSHSKDTVPEYNSLP